MAKLAKMKLPRWSFAQRSESRDYARLQRTVVGLSTIVDSTNQRAAVLGHTPNAPIAAVIRKRQKLN